jgi:outer membrane protein assembly factor BamE (lipoprotein component of BamABCDE complex)
VRAGIVTAIRQKPLLRHKTAAGLVKSREAPENSDPLPLPAPASLPQIALEHWIVPANGATPGVGSSRSTEVIIMQNWTIAIAAALIAGCVGAPGVDADRNLTVGTVQKEIGIGMSGAEVAEVLGSPNIVSTDENRNEVWIYDKISSQTVQTDNRGAVAVIRFISDVGPIGGSSRQQTETTSQRTLTVIIKFDEHDRVRDFAYHTSRF